MIEFKNQIGFGFKAENFLVPPPGAPIGDMDWEVCGY